MLVYIFLKASNIFKHYKTFECRQWLSSKQTYIFGDIWPIPYRHAVKPTRQKNISLRMRACCISPNHPLSAISLNHNYTCLFPPMKTSFSRSDTFAYRSLTRMALPTCSKLCPRVIVKYSTSLAITSIFVLSEQNTEIAQNAINFINL